ncbi:hypothetical protein LguiA_007023 [Lonicera macranthoides]
MSHPMFLFRLGTMKVILANCDTMILLKLKGNKSRKRAEHVASDGILTSHLPTLALLGPKQHHNTHSQVTGTHDCCQH